MDRACAQIEMALPSEMNISGTSRPVTVFSRMRRSLKARVSGGQIWLQEKDRQFI